MQQRLQKSSSRLIRIVIILMFLFNTFITAEEKTQEIFNKLYLEIFSVSDSKHLFKNDSAQPTSTTVSETTLHKNITSSAHHHPDKTSEQLTKEIDKLIHDANLRHSDAVKFMLDEK